MKKFLSMALAATMIMSMAAVAFAADPVLGTLSAFNSGQCFDVDNKNFVPATEYKYGNTYYYLLSDDTNGVGNRVYVVDQKDAKDLKITAKWDTNGDYVESVGWEKVIIKDASTNNQEKGVYLIAVKLKEQPTSTKTKDIIGTITVKDSSSKNFDLTDSAKEIKIEVALTAKNPAADSMDQTADKTQVFEFKEDNGTAEEEHEISLYADAGKFVVNTIGQGKLVIKTNVKYNAGIEGVAPDVNYTYFNGNNATFNRLGNLYLNANEGEFLYKVNADGTLTKVDAKYDSDEEAFVVRTRVIGSYVISEKELDVEKVNAGVKAPEETAPVAPVAPTNPGTGAAC